MVNILASLGMRMDAGIQLAVSRIHSYMGWCVRATRSRDVFSHFYGTWHDLFDLSNVTNMTDREKDCMTDSRENNVF